MKFECFLCTNLYFDENKQVIKHLKNDHKINEKVHQIKCTVKNSHCGKFFNTFSGLNRHVRFCTRNFDASSVSINERSEAENRVDEDISFIFNDSLSIATESNLNNQKSAIDYVHESDCNNDNINAADANDFFYNINENDAHKESNIEEEVFSAEQLSSELIGMNLNEKDLNTIFHVLQKMLIRIQGFCLAFLKVHEENPLEALDTAMSFIRNDLHQLSSTYKRKLAVEKNELYVKPRDIGIGTQWDLRRDKSCKSVLPVHRQSLFHYISPIETIKTLFKRESIRKTYFDYNKSVKHVCAPGVYKHFCCGSVYKSNKLFQEHPNALQLQFFLDGFEICSALKTKTKVY